MTKPFIPESRPAFIAFNAGHGAKLLLIRAAMAGVEVFAVHDWNKRVLAICMDKMVAERKAIELGVSESNVQSHWGVTILLLEDGNWHVCLGESYTVDQESAMVEHG